MTWKGRIEAAKIAGAFTAEDQRLASYWHTCAVSEAEAVYGVNIYTIGDDDVYYAGTDMGKAFAAAVSLNNVRDAETLYESIMKLAEKVATSDL